MRGKILSFDPDSRYNILLGFPEPNDFLFFMEILYWRGGKCIITFHWILNGGMVELKQTNKFHSDIGEDSLCVMNEELLILFSPVINVLVTVFL